MPSYLNSVISYKKPSNNVEIIKSYEGKIDQDLVKNFTEEIERYFNLPENDFALKTGKKVFHVMVELLQNVCKHSNTKSKKIANVGEGAFVLSSDGENYYVKIGNIAKTEDTTKISSRLEEFNKLDESELKVKYRELIKASRISEKGGAGLGLIDIIKKTKNKIDYQTTPIDNDYNYFIQQSTINII